MLVCVSVKTLSAVDSTTTTNKAVVWKSNNIIFTLIKLAGHQWHRHETTNLMNNRYSRHDYDAKVAVFGGTYKARVSFSLRRGRIFDLSQPAFFWPQKTPSGMEITINSTHLRTPGRCCPQGLWHKKRVAAATQPLLTLNLILWKTRCKVTNNQKNTK